MIKSIALGILAGALSAGLVQAADAADKISLHALFKNKAIVIVDGARHVLKAGETSPEGVTLIETDTAAEVADVEVAGQRMRLRLGVVGAPFKPSERASVTLYAEPSGHFHADGLINDVAVRFLVDTGATTIAMSGVAADRIGIDYKRRGQPGYARTAGGIVITYNVKLDRVTVGDITLFNVEAGVIEGSHPSEVLLGMSFLGRVDMRRDGEKMELQQRF